MLRTGLLGGSFNPAHRAHRAITLAALREGLVTPAADGDTVCVLSGGNIEWEGLQALLAGR